MGAGIGGRSAWRNAMEPRRLCGALELRSNPGQNLYHKDYQAHKAENSAQRNYFVIISSFVIFVYLVVNMEISDSSGTRLR